MTSAATVQRNQTFKRSATMGVRPYRSLRGWAIATLMETHAIIECPAHEHIRDRGSWAHGWDEARTIAEMHPFPGTTSATCVAEINDIMASVGDVCPEC